jgi:hypothetical protein
MQNRNPLSELHDITIQKSISLLVTVVRISYSTRNICYVLRRKILWSLVKQSSFCLSEHRVVNMPSVYNTVVDAYTKLFRDYSGKQAACKEQSVPGLKIPSVS